MSEEAVTANAALAGRVGEIQWTIEDEVHQMDEFVETKMQQVGTVVGCGCTRTCRVFFFAVNCDVECDRIHMRCWWDVGFSCTKCNVGCNCT